MAKAWEALAALFKGATVAARTTHRGQKLTVANALMSMFKSRSAPKYIRKVPTKARTKSGGIRYRYIYADTGAARASKKDEKVNLQGKGVHHVVSSDEHGVVLKHERTGEERHVTHADLHAEMASLYKKRFDRGAEALIKQFVRSVPNITADPDNPAATHEALRERFSDAGVDELTAKHLIGFLAGRDGWKSDAKKSLLTLASDRAMGKMVAPRARSIARGAENLSQRAGQKQVRSRDVAKAAALRVPEGGFDSRLAELQSKARVELATVKTMLGAIEAIGSNEAAKRSMVDYATTLLSHDASHELEQLAVAFPGLADVPELDELRQVRAKWASLLSERTQAVKDKSGVYGVDATMYVPDAEGSPVPQKTRYRIVEAGEVIASHDPLKGFIQRKDYPENVQERQYHSNRGEQEKVRVNAQKLLPPFIVNTNTDAVNGPPIMTSEGHVLGGNSRAMSLQVAYEDHPVVANTYRDYLSEHAHEFGFSKGDIGQFKNPVLVREVEIDDKSTQNLGVLVRRYNENFTQGLDPRVDQVARGRLVNKGLLNAIAEGMSQSDDAGEPVHATLNAFLSSPDGKTLVKQMQSKSDGRAIIDKRNRSQYINKDGSFNEDGKTFVERVLVGHVIPDPDLLSEMLPTQVSAIAASVPHVVAAASHGHDIQRHLKPVLETMGFMRKQQLTSLRELDNYGGGFADFSGDASFGQGKPKLDPDGRKMLELLYPRMSKPRSVAAFFRSFAQAAQKFKISQQADIAIAGADRKIGPGWSPEEDALSRKGVTIGGLMDLADGQTQPKQAQRGFEFGKGRMVKSDQPSMMSWVPMSLAFGEWVWSRSLSKGPSLMQYPDGSQQYMHLPSSMLKAKGEAKSGAKYVKRVATNNPKRPWRYFYAVHHAGGVHNKADFKEGSRFAHGAGHITIHGVKDGKLIISHSVDHKKTPSHHGDDTHSARTAVTHEALADMLASHHREKLDEHKEKLSKEHAEAVENGNLKGAERIREEAKRLGHDIPTPTIPTPAAEDEFDWSGGGAAVAGGKETVADTSAPPDTVSMIYGTGSSNVDRIQWTPDAKGSPNGALRVQFASGAIYEYANVHHAVATAMAQSGGPGTFFNQNITGKYDSTKLRDRSYGISGLSGRVARYARNSEPLDAASANRKVIAARKQENRAANHAARARTDSVISTDKGAVPVGRSMDVDAEQRALEAERASKTPKAGAGKSTGIRGKS